MKESTESNFEKTKMYKYSCMDDVYAPATWIAQQAKNAKYFVTLNFSYDVTRQQADKSAIAFQQRVSVAIAGNDARKGRYQHPMLIVAEKQPSSQRWHLHILLDGVPEQYQKRVKERGLALREICAKAWDSMNGTGKTRKTGGASIEFENGMPKFKYEWFKPIADLNNLAEYISKTFSKQSSDFLVVT